jgi:hypothetical protein
MPKARDKRKTLNLISVLSGGPGPVEGERIFSMHREEMTDV